MKMPTPTQIAHASALIAAAVAAVTGSATGTPTATRIGAGLTAFLVGLAGLYIKPPAKRINHPKPPKGNPKPRKPFLMADAVTVSSLPRGVRAYFGYVAGNSFINFAAVKARFPGSRVLGITLTHDVITDMFDIEPGGGTPDQAGPWILRGHEADRKAGQPLKRRMLYSDLSDLPAVMRSLQASGIPRTAVRICPAHPNGIKHICGPHTCGRVAFDVDATQYEFAGAFDMWLCRGDFLDG